MAVIALAAAGALIRAEVKTTDPVTRQVREIGKELKCQCGCSYTISDCNMLYCHFRDPVNQEIEEGVRAGLAPSAIVASLLKKYGEALRSEPRPEGFGAVGWAMPFAALALGFVAAPFVVRRWRRNQAAADKDAAGVDPATIKKFEAEIEKNLADED